jgi:hypothetical protein
VEIVRAGIEDARYSDCWEEAMRLERQGRLKAAEELLLKLVKADEDESTATGLGVAPAGYARLAIIYRRQGRYKDEIKILERFANQKHAPGVGPSKLLKRLEKARRSFGEPPPRVVEGDGRRVDDVAAMACSPLGNADQFLHAIRTARHYNGSSVVSKNAPLRLRGEAAPAFIEVDAPRPVPALATRIVFLQS